MKHLALIATGLGMLATAWGTQVVAAPQADVYQQSYALYMLYHPETKDQSSVALKKQFSADFTDLFATHKKVDVVQFTAFEQQRLTELMKQRREMSLKQSHVRFGILDSNKDQKMTLKEFQASGMKTFDEMDKNKDGLISTEDVKLAAGNGATTHDGFRVRLPIAMPMANNQQEFIQKYGQGKAYATLGDYLTERDKQFMATDTNADLVVSEQEYVDEFMQRFDRNSIDGQEKMKELSKLQFQAIAQGKSHIQAKDIAQFANKLDKAISQ